MTENNTKTTAVSGLLGSLEQAGLEPNEAIIYEVLVVNGPLPAGKICQKTPLKRGLVYKVLESLVAAGLVIKHDEPGKVAVFEPAHPVKLQELAEHKEKEAKQAQTALASVLPQLTSTFNLAVGKPGVQFFEGMDGIKQVIQDTLQATGEVLQYLDLDELETRFAKESAFYTQRRQNLKITKRLLVRDTPLARTTNLSSDKLTQARFLRSEQPLDALAYIYDEKVAYITLDPERLIGIIINDARLANLNRFVFNSLWDASIART
jgi:sugar-specific transcriptional regulator TrmB